MARGEKTTYTCTAEYTEGCDKRLTEAMVDIYYNRLRGIREDPDLKEEHQEIQSPA